MYFLFVTTQLCIKMRLRVCSNFLNQILIDYRTFSLRSVCHYDNYCTYESSRGSNCQRYSGILTMFP